MRDACSPSGCPSSSLALLPPTHAGRRIQLFHCLWMVIGGGCFMQRPTAAFRRRKAFTFDISLAEKECPNSMQERKLTCKYERVNFCFICLLSFVGGVANKYKFTFKLFYLKIFFEIICFEFPFVAGAQIPKPHTPSGKKSVPAKVQFQYLLCQFRAPLISTI